MDISEKAKETLDGAGKEIREALDGLRNEVSELTQKVKEKLKGTGEEMKETAQELTQEVKNLSEKVRELIPGKKKKRALPVRAESFSGFHPETLEQSFYEWRKAVDRLFDEWFRDFGWPTAGWRPRSLFMPDIPVPGVPAAGLPRADVDETEEEIRITAELPGVDKDDLEVSISDDRVIISGEKKDETEDRGRGYHRVERYYGAFHRQLPLPAEVDREKAEAVFKDGVLTLRLPKTPAAREKIRKIEIRNA
ncbi:MAG: hypothetical protein DRH56_07935 [Deltaproteobacteria bacterium]|nr:MAG: hypothetical protein DRH56_07935 [Deltaproteobacteria bacterium]